MNEEEINNFIKESVDKAIACMKVEMQLSDNISDTVKFFKERKFNMYHPDVTPKLREYIFDLMDRWPRVTFYEHCLITYFFKITESPDITYEINPKEEKDVTNTDNNLLDEII